MLTPAQKNIFAKTDTSDIELLTEQQFIEISNMDDCQDLPDQQLLAFLKLANALYRGGEPLIADARYDHHFLAEFQRRHPDHPFLQTVEPEPAFAGKTVKLPVHMLSTDKAYDRESIEKWLNRIEKAALDLNKTFEQLQFRVTPKLDGYAAYDDGKKLYTRGDGRKGTDITRVFERGLIVAEQGKRGQGAGEIVISRTYFAAHLSEQFDNARNFQASIIKEKQLDEIGEAAIKSHAAVFYPFAQLPDWSGNAQQLMDQFDSIVEQNLNRMDYDVDGVILEITDPELKQLMGSTRHHHRWQIAFKYNVYKASVEVLSVTPQTSRSGRVNPVAELQPTRLSGALISRATAHHYGMVKEMGIGPGAIIELTRSGLVIPKIERVLQSAKPEIPKQCPSCNTELDWDNDYLFCPNSAFCPAQIENSIEYFFKTLANIDGFGTKTVEKLHSFGVKSVLEVYQLTLEQLQNMGFGDKTAANLLDQLQRSRNETIEDWRFLGAFGINRMGLGNCERLLQHYPLTEIFTLTEQDLIAIEGFAEKTAQSVAACLKEIQPEFTAIHNLGFNLIATPIVSDDKPDSELSPIHGKTIVFTGTMKQGSRDEMKKTAKQAGAKVAASVTGKTDYLVAGDKTGAAKLTAAKEKGVMILSEQAYLELFNS